MRAFTPHNRKKSPRPGMTLIELLVAMTILAALMFGVSMIYFSCLKVYLRTAWKLPPYDEATMAVQEMTRQMRDAMLIDSFGADWLVVVIPRKDANHDNVLIDAGGSLSLTPGNQLAFYLSDDTGSLTASGNNLWLAVKAEGAESFTPKKKLAENIHPELNPTNPTTGQPYTMFRYWPDETRLWGVEMWITSTAQVYGQTRTQFAHSEVYLRNL